MWRHSHVTTRERRMLHGTYQLLLSGLTRASCGHLRVRAPVPSLRPQRYAQGRTEGVDSVTVSTAERVDMG